MITYFLQIFGKYYDPFKGHFESIHDLYEYLKKVEPNLAYVDERDRKAYARMTKKEKKTLFESSLQISTLDHKKNRHLMKMYRQPT